MEPQYRQIHEELCQADLTREDFISKLLEDNQLMNDIISCCLMSKDQ